ncbi:MAG: sigma-70 family RNA polymerase sigma factor [Planctomycetota bacterium]|nr:sigma-70 family RNA polymerase sigma factor [Planctomycetaceae bacterium]MDQ3332257.1 sigma-70 family RNA polymerase sigma factor [Planctomycetota bacterium]
MDSQQIVDQLVVRVIAGDRSALAELFEGYRPRLWRIVRFRLHPRLQGRIDADDVLQDAWLRAETRIGAFITEASQSCFVWFRMIVTQALVDLHRRHLGADKRDARRECSLDGRWSAESTVTSLTFHLADRLPSPSSAAAKIESAERLDSSLEALGDLDREVLVLRHFEELTNSETAMVLGITEQAASMRYVRALDRLRAVMEAAQVK